jgi:MoaA/NifB/PqqE/SkfB family radical SAM enzyme
MPGAKAVPCIPGRLPSTCEQQGQEMKSANALIKSPGVRVRCEHFGALAWQASPRRIYRLDAAAAAALLLHDQPRPEDEQAPPVAGLGITGQAWHQAVAGLRSQNLLVPVQAAPAGITAEDVRTARHVLDSDTPRCAVLKPLWVHIQPFTRCNQHCIHCYCHGGPKADPFLLPVGTWLSIISQLDDYGVFDVYVTGGESLLYDGFFTIAEEILSRGMGFGVSTNATILPERTLAQLRDLRIETVQVSLDGARAAMHEHIRGAPGSFTRTLEGITRIAAFSQPVINTVVSRINMAELEDVVKLGREHGCARFKFFPQKPAGRSGRELTLSDDEIMGQLIPECARLAAAHDVEIETIDPGRPCGSGSIGFALDQRADIYPCIFGVADATQRCGNILSDDLSEVWFGSPVLGRFRGEAQTPCRRCER